MCSSHQHCCLCTTSNFTYTIQMRESTVTELNIPRTLTFFPSNPKRPQGNICNPGLLQYSQAWLAQQDPFLGFKFLTLKVHRIGFPQDLQEAGGMGMGSSINGNRYLNTCVSCCLWNLHKSSEENVDGTLYLSIFLTDSCSQFLHALKFSETINKELNPKLIG